MGFFSWKTMDTHRSISNSYSSHGTFPVVMIDNNNNKWVEDNYEGYGVFGGKDYYELLAEMNGKKTRYEGIDLDFNNNNFEVIYPNLIEAKHIDTWKWENDSPEHCEYQGFFY
jgi:hypothetical protein